MKIGLSVYWIALPEVNLVDSLSDCLIIHLMLQATKVTTNVTLNQTYVTGHKQLLQMTLIGLDSVVLHPQLAQDLQEIILQALVQVNTIVRSQQSKLSF